MFFRSLDLVVDCIGLWNSVCIACVNIDILCLVGDLVPYDPNRIFSCEGLELVKENDKTLKELKEK